MPTSIFSYLAVLSLCQLPHYRVFPTHTYQICLNVSASTKKLWPVFMHILYIQYNLNTHTLCLYVFSLPVVCIKSNSIWLHTIANICNKVKLIFRKGCRILSIETCNTVQKALFHLVSALGTEYTYSLKKIFLLNLRLQLLNSP